MPNNDDGKNHTRYECDTCGTRFATEKPDPACERCGRPEEALTKVSPLPENSIRVYCYNCDFEATIHEEDAYFPGKLAEARAKLHSSQGQHPTRFERLLGEEIENLG